MCADAEYRPIIPQGEHGEGVGGERGAGGGHTVVSLSPSHHHSLPRHLNKGISSVAKFRSVLLLTDHARSVYYVRLLGPYLDFNLGDSVNT